MRRIFILAGLLLLVLVVPSHSANPGGMGDSSRDLSCGGSCHSDPGLSQSSSAGFQFELDRTSAYVGGPISITVSAIAWTGRPVPACGHAWRGRYTRGCGLDDPLGWRGGFRQLRREPRFRFSHGRQCDLESDRTTFRRCVHPLCRRPPRWRRLTSDESVTGLHHRCRADSGESSSDNRLGTDDLARTR